MTDKPLVSIALCTYNGAQYLAQQLETLVGQTYPNIEIIAVDDVSKDDTVNILEQFAARHTNFSIHRNTENLGYIKNFEKAISLCKGQYIALADQDDIWELNKIELLLQNIGNAALIYHDSEFIDEQGLSIGRKVSDVRNFYAGTNANIFLLENCVSGHALMFNRELLKYFTGFNREVIHDWWLTYMACNNGGVTFINDVLVKYRQHTQANTNILRQDRGEAKKKDSLLRIEKLHAIAAAFAGYPYNTDQAFKQRYFKLMDMRMHSYFSFRLFWFIFNRRDSLLYIQKKSALSKFNFSLKYAWGYLLKKLFN
ncbi:glycosyltransferase involved in cell wall biosynthesis [Mucilaginibacter yixingensis]|uniref:Glycosyltransferase involved in cell wall biosynthesis n=1 Tax=Mucilaginibacter yixingensis TaxID=1295612 RepID=A0A2T5JC11_9SPHI|nr:glycosyltransferase family 2 protein [Mucilaginibacter yixingensis]PTQ99290.1 glycosyltransferase involved in cell wall biosynthesis [Mucilaginibacter yixingensis]